MREMWILVLFMLFSNQVEAQYYMTQSGMYNLLETERNLSKTLSDIYTQRMKVVVELEQLLNKAESGIPRNASDTKYERYASHPTNSWLILKRFLTKWSKNEIFLHGEKFKKHIETLKTVLDSLNSRFNNTSEMQGAVYALLKIQETYGVSVKDFIRGFGEISHRMTAEDVFLVGYYGTHLSYFSLAKIWLDEALKIYLADELYKQKLPQVYELIAWCCYKTDQLECAVDYAIKHLESDPDSYAAKNNVYYYRRYLMADEDEQDEENLTRKKVKILKKPWMVRHDAMCRGEESVPDRIRKTLYCAYYTPSYEFYLKPLKMEIIYHKPKLYQFHDILSEHEMSHIIEKAKSKLDFSRVYSTISGANTKAGYRLSKNAWLDPDEDEITNNLFKRVGALTNLNMKSSELLQVANYGIGGNYEPHYDFAPPSMNASVFGYYGQFGNRIATILFYLTDVKLGGATVFTQAGKGVMASPKKGSAILWYNLKRNGKGDFRTRHAGCPIGLGEKWIANLWIHEYGQELRRPCTLDPRL